MVEGDEWPALRSMATLAGRATGGFSELAAVRILMTVVAGRAQAEQLQPLFAAAVDDGVTRPAGESRMPAGKGPTGPGVIEGDLTPTGQRVASRAPPLGHEAGRLAAMGIAVADGAAGIGEAKATFAPGPGGRMAGPAGDGQVGPGKLVIRGLMLREAEGGGHEPVDRVAALAGPAVVPGGELALVWIVVADRASIERESAARRSATMAALTSQPGMGAAQREARPIMVEAGERDPLPALGSVTAAAGGAEPSGVGVAMAVRALAECEAAEASHAVLPYPMTAFAGHRRVRTGQWEAGLGVVEAGRAPRFLPMAARASRSELTLVRVRVTGETALPGEPEEGSSGVAAAADECLGVGDGLRAMAGATVEQEVGAEERMAGLAVIEGLAAPFPPPDQLEVATLMLDVTALAIAVPGPRVQATARGDALGELAMAGEAAGGSDAAGGLVTVQAVA